MRVRKPMLGMVHLCVCVCVCVCVCAHREMYAHAFVSVQPCVCQSTDAVIYARLRVLCVLCLGRVQLLTHRGAQNGNK